MRVASIAAIAVCAVSISAVPVAAQTMSAAQYVAQAGAGDLYERQSSEIVLSSTKNAKIREFAQMMIKHHTKSTNDVKMAAKSDGIKVMPPKLMPKQSEMIAQLNAQTGSMRDATYLSQQKTAHAEALALHQGYATSGSTKSLRKAASMIVPVVQKHIDMLKGM